jgi:glycosyltransferase domain-containing protein
MNYSDELTVVIPTYNRPIHLKRSLDYWGGTDFNVIVADGSGERFDGEIPPNIRYIYDNLSSIAQRWSNSIQKVNTPYIVVCADDDFYSINGLEVCLSFLNSHADYVSAQGLTLSFKIDNLPKITRPFPNLKILGHEIDGGTAKERLNQLFKDYVYQVYSIFRTPILQLTFETCKDQKNGNYIELGAAIIPSIFGKHKVMPVFYSARESLADSGSYNIEVPRFDILKPKGLLDYQQWRDKIAQIYSDTEGVSINDAIEVIEDVFKQYNEWDLRIFPTRQPLEERIYSPPLRHATEIKKIKRLIKLNIKKLIPISFLEIRRYFLSRNSMGFQYSDPNAKSDWKKMVEVIIRHNTTNQKKS